jgi:hypothetical protein
MDTKTLEQEKNELNALINKGITFEIEDTQFEVKKRFFGLLKKRVPVKVRRQFRIEQPTLSTLDRIAAEWIEVAIDEAVIKSDDGMQYARTLAAKHGLRCAKIVAIAVLGSDYLIPKHAGKGVARYDEDVKRLNELTSLFARTITPSQLLQIAMMITTICNLADFMHSIRLMSADRDTMPIRIETNSED